MTPPRHSVDPLSGPVPNLEPEVLEGGVARPRVIQSQITVEGGHPVGIAVAGRGVPLVVVHGFSAQGFLYAQTLSRLVGMGYKVIAIDTAGHGGTHGLPRGGADLADYAELLGRSIDALGIRKAVLAGHSMGGRLVIELAAARPELVIAVLLVDAIVGDRWDDMVRVFRRAPPLMMALGAILAADTASTVPFFRDPRQAVKLLRLAAPVGAGVVARPWRLLGPSWSILRSSASRELIEEAAEAGVAVIAIHGDRDLAVPLATGRSAAKIARGQLVTVEGGSHSWVLKDPETLPAIIGELQNSDLGAAEREALVDAGLVPGVAGLDEIESAFYEPGAAVLEVPTEASATALDLRPRLPRYRWRIERP